MINQICGLSRELNKTPIIKEWQVQTEYKRGAVILKDLTLQICVIDHISSDNYDDHTHFWGTFANISVN